MSDKKRERTEMVVWTTPGVVELIDSMGSDLSIIRRRGKSFDTPPPSWEYNERCSRCGLDGDEAREQRTCEGDDFGQHDLRRSNPHLSLKNLGRLEEAMVNKHASLFEGVEFEFHVKAPIKVARDWFRHRTHSFNEVSTRFSLMKHEIYVPTGELMRAQTGSASQASFSPLEEPFGTVASDIIREQAEAAFDAYETLLLMGVAREVASYVLPLNTMTAFYDKANLRNWLNFLVLRGKDGYAIEEMKILADRIETLITGVVPQAMELWNKHGRQPL